MTGEKIYEYDLDVTGMTDYGVTLQAILSGQASVPPQGARIDVAFEGRASGRLAGRVGKPAFATTDSEDDNRPTGRRTTWCE